MKKNKSVTLEAVKYNYKAVILRLSLIIAVAIIGLIIPITQSKIVNNVTSGDYSIAINFLVITITLVVIEQIGAIFRRKASWNLVNSITMYLSKRLVNETFDNSLYSLSRFNFSLYSNILNSDINVIAEYCTGLLTDIVKVFELVYVLVYFYFINVVLGIIATVGLIINIIFIYIVRKKISKANQVNLSTTDEQINMVDNIFHGIKDIKNLNISNNIVDKYHDITKKSVESTGNLDLLNSGVKKANVIIIEIIRHVIYAIGVYFIAKGSLELGTILIIYSYFSKIVDFSTILSGMYISLAKYKVSLERYNKVFEYVRKDDSKEYIDFKNGNIVFKDVVYGDINNLSLKNLNLTIKENSVTALNSDDEAAVRGVFELLNKLNFQHSGIVTINDVDISLFEPSSYQDNIAFIDKNPMFFNMSIKDNLLLLNKDFDYCLSVSKRLKIHKYIEELKDGYDTVLENDCSNLQFKMRYLLEILRAFIFNPKILLIDDIFDGLDDIDIINLVNVINEEKNNKTIVIKASNSKIYEIADSIIIFNNDLDETEVFINEK